jgi:hypothetical protein
MVRATCSASMVRLRARFESVPANTRASPASAPARQRGLVVARAIRIGAGQRSGEPGQRLGPPVGVGDGARYLLGSVGGGASQPPYQP